MADEVVKFVRGNEVKFTFERFQSQLEGIGWERADKPKPVVIEPEVKEEPEVTKADLVAKARELGLDVDGRMSEARIRDLIAEAEAEAE